METDGALMSAFTTNYSIEKGMVEVSPAMARKRKPLAFTCGIRHLSLHDIREERQQSSSRKRAR
jgi:hypothetical protein